MKGGSVHKARLVVTALASSLLAVLWAPGVASLLLPEMKAADPFVAGHYVLAAALAGAVSGACGASGKYLGLAATLLVGAIAAGGLAVLGSVPLVVGATLVVLCVILGCVARLLILRLPSSLEDLARARPLLAGAWLLLAIGCVFQVGRLATFVSDQDTDYHLGTTDSFWAGHMCMPSYLYAAELNERAEENVYSIEHYPLWTPEVELGSRYEFAEPDDFLYPPPFLLLPRAVIAISSDFQLIYSMWFAIQATAFLFVALSLASWIGGQVGTAAALALPLLMLSFPILFNLQYGQFHLAAILLGVYAMLQFRRGRDAAGGFLLGFAIVAKIFPGLLLIWLAGQRRWKAISWVGAACVVYTGLGLAVLGPEPFSAFVSYEMPRLSSGAAFWYDDLYPSFANTIAASLQSPYGLVLKLGALGVPGMTKAVGAIACKAFAAVLLIVAFRAARTQREDRSDEAILWLAFLGFGSLVNTGAWGDYIPIPALWILTLLIPRAARRRRLIIPLLLTGTFQFFILGTMPVGEWFDIRVMAPLALVGAALLYGLYAWCLLKRPDGGALTAGPVP